MSTGMLEIYTLFNYALKNLYFLRIFRHGYGRWQSILDKEPGFFNIIRVEINLPDSIFGGMQMHDGVNSVGADGVLEPSYQESSMYSYRDAQRRMVEFVKKRVYLLEKGLNAEYAKLYFVS